jgi:hypothetical protein
MVERGRAEARPYNSFGALEDCIMREGWSKKLEPGRFAEGPRSPGFVLPVSAVSEQEDRQFKLAKTKTR